MIERYEERKYIPLDGIIKVQGKRRIRVERIAGLRSIPDVAYVRDVQEQELQILRREGRERRSKWRDNTTCSRERRRGRDQGPGAARTATQWRSECLLEKAWRSANHISVCRRIEGGE